MGVQWTLLTLFNISNILTNKKNVADPGFGNGGGKIFSEASYIYERSELRAKRV